MQDLRATAELVGARPAPGRPLGARRRRASPRRRRRGRSPIRTPRSRRRAAASRCGRAQLLERRAATRASVDDNERFGFRLRNGAIEMQLGERNWQALSDPRTRRRHLVQRRPARRRSRASPTFCAKPCAGRQHDLPAAPAGPQLRDRSSPAARRPTPLRDARAAQRGARPQRRRRRQLRGMTAMAHRPRPVDRQRGVAALFVTVTALLRDGPGGRRRAIATSLVEEQRSANELRAASRLRGRRGRPRMGARAHQRSDPDRRRLPAERRRRAALSFRERTGSHRRRRRAMLAPRDLERRRHVATPLQAACVRGADGWTCSCPASGRAAAAGAVGMRHRRRHSSVELAAVSAPRRRPRRRHRLHPHAMRGGACAASADAATRRRRASKRPGRCCRRCGPRRPPR